MCEKQKYIRIFISGAKPKDNMLNNMKNKIQSQEFEQECPDFPGKKQVDVVLGAIEIKSKNSE